MSSDSIPVFLAGEGRNELGGWLGDPAYQDHGEDGVMVVLLRNVRASGWHVVGARSWRPESGRSRRSRGRSNFVAPKRFKVGGREAPARFEHGDTGIVIEAANDALDYGSRLVALLRDADKDSDRVAAMNEGVAWIQRELAAELAVVGGVATPKLEGWVLSCAGVHGTEAMSGAKADAELKALQVAAKDTRAMVSIVAAMNPRELPKDAVGLRGWLEAAGLAFASIDAAANGM